MLFYYNATASEITALINEGFEPEILHTDSQLEMSLICIKLEDGYDLMRFANAQRKDEVSCLNQFIREAI